MRTQNQRTQNQRTLKSAYAKKSLCVDTKNFLAFTQKLGQTLKNVYTNLFYHNTLTILLHLSLVFA